MRRADIDHMIEAELAIRRAVIEVEKLPADARLTEAVILLGRAQDRVADWVDALPARLEHFGTDK